MLTDLLKRLLKLWPIPMELYCPECSNQHIDAPQPERGWTNPVHRTHECQACGHQWRPYAFATNGVARRMFKHIYRDEPECCICGNFGPAEDGPCQFAPWLRFLSTKKFHTITPDCPAGKSAMPLFTRWMIFRRAPIAVFAHFFHRSDIDEHHDHPWSFITFLLHRGYWEHVPNGYFWSLMPYWRSIFTKYEFTGNDIRIWRPRFSILYRPATFRHYIEIDKPTWTIVIRFRRCRDWGFWVKGQFIQWKQMEEMKSRSICE